jgi:hypothetical protein
MPRVRPTSGGKEGEILARARALARDFAPLLPRLEGEDPPGPFARLREDLETVHEAREDASTLRRLAGRGEDLARAYAGLLHYAIERPRLDMLVARLPTGDVPYLPVASAPPESLVAVQYYDDPRRRLYGYLKWARGGLLGSGGRHFYALEREVVCTGRRAEPPEGFVRATLARLPYRLLESPGEESSRVFECVHRQRGEPDPYLELRWRSAKLSLRLCRRCAREDAHILGGLLENMLVPDPEREFEVRLRQPLRHVHESPCAPQGLESLASPDLRRYRAGRLSDREFLEGYATLWEEAFQRDRTSGWVVAGVCYGHDADRLLEDLRPNPVEREALRAGLREQQGGLWVSEATPGKVLEALWPEHGPALLTAIGATEAEVSRYVRSGESPPHRVSELLARLSREHRQREAIAALPTYGDLPPEAAFVDGLARAYRTDGEPAVEKRILSSTPPEGKLRGIAWAFLLAIGRDRHQAWRFSDTEQEFGRALRPAAEELLRAPPEDYHRALKTFLRQAGLSTGPIGDA